jgi:HK97 family phage major capsid protein
MPDGGDIPTEQELKNLTIDFKKATDEVKTFAEKVTTELKNLGATTNETKEQADKALVEMNGIGARLTEVEQKMARRGSTQQVETKSLGQHVIDSAEYKALVQSKGGQARIPVEWKDITSATGTVGSGASPSTSLVMADRQPMIPYPTYRLVVRDLITPGSTESNAIEYPVETSVPTATSAYVVAEGAQKPQSDLTFDLKSSPVRTIAHFMKASRQITDDAPQLRSYIDGRLRFGLSYVEENELLYGDGTGQHLHGIIPQATAYSAAFSPANAQNIDVLRLASLQATLGLYPATGFVMHPTDWARIELTKDQYGNYIIGQPQGSTTRTLWGLPVVATQAMAVGHFLTGAFNNGAQIFDRMAIEVLISTENQDDFIKNMLTIRGEERLALAVYVPRAFITGAFL